jgi:putative endonuclease
MKTYYVYVIGSKTGTLYVGMTNDINRRVYEHKNHLIPGFTNKYNIGRRGQAYLFERRGQAYLFV